jgi:hypothetical protein
MKINDLMILDDEQIDYDSLSEEQLHQLVYSDNLFMATSALIELRFRNKILACLSASSILSNSSGDCYLQAAAIETLFQTNPHRAMDYMKTLDGTCHPYILNSIMEIIMENSSKEFQWETGRKVPQIIYDIVQSLTGGDEFIDSEVKSQFLNWYSDDKKLRSNLIVHYVA